MTFFNEIRDHTGLYLKWSPVFYFRKTDTLNDKQIVSCSKLKGNDYELLEIHKDVMSGGNRNRKGFLRAMRDIETKNFDIFLAYDVSRIARDVYAFLKIFNKLKL